MDLSDTEDFGCEAESCHDRVIVHLDADCFYAQVEMLKNPRLRERPLGVRQKNLIVTANYPARESGVRKCMWVPEALEVCPALVLVDGEDLHDYRKYSEEVHALLREYGCKVEKLGLDENFVDVTELVEDGGREGVEGEVYGGSEGEKCLCGCHGRLSAGSRLAAEMRARIKERVGLTTCGGVAHNKLLAKLVGSVHRPDRQTTLFPSRVDRLLSSLGGVRKLPGVGTKTAETLSLMGIVSVEDLRLADLSGRFDAKTAERLGELARGVDRSEVKESGKPRSLGIEDADRRVTTKREVEEKLRSLMGRLWTLLEEDGRTPGTVKVTVRRKEAGSRESRQTALSPSLLPRPGSRPTGDSPLLTTILSLVSKMVRLDRPFHLTLLGLAFSKFTDVGDGILSFVRRGPPTSREASSSSGPPSDAPEEAFPCPPGVDSSTFFELPPEIRKELAETWKTPAIEGRDSPPKPPPNKRKSRPPVKRKYPGQTSITSYFNKNS